MKECESKSIIDYCHCMPLFSIESYDNLIPCTIDHYEKCKKRPNCNFDKCPDQCNQKVLSFDHIVYNNLKSYNDSMAFYLQTKDISHPAFKEIYSMTSMGFWASLGGVFDFWIGASVISGVHLVVYITKQFIYMFKKKTKTGKNMRHLLRGLRRNRNEQNQMIDLLTLGIRQQSIEHNTRQTPEKLEEIEISTEQMELHKNDTKQQIDLLQENINQKIDKLTEQVAEQQQKTAEQMEFLKNFVKQQEQQMKKISERFEQLENKN